MKIITKTILGLSIILILSGCYNRSNIVGVRGNQPLMGYSLAEMRDARRAVKVHSTAPSDAVHSQEISTQRCHQYANEPAPTETMITDDLKLVAYAHGFDGITNLRFTEESALFGNCWFILTGYATAFQKSE